MQAILLQLPGDDLKWIIHQRSQTQGKDQHDCCINKVTLYIKPITPEYFKEQSMNQIQFKGMGPQKAEEYIIKPDFQCQQETKATKLITASVCQMKQIQLSSISFTKICSFSSSGSILSRTRTDLGKK